HYHQHLSSNEMKNELFIAPLVKGMFFLFSALGLVDIAYKSPVNKKYQLFREPYLTLFDGLKYVRLNDFGKFVCGINPSYDLKIEDTPTQILLDEKRLIITIKGNGRREKMILSRLAETINENHFKISYQSFLKDCHSTRDILQNISIFKDKICSNLPPNWREFFDEIEAKINPLQKIDDMSVFKIKPAKQLIALIAHDDILKYNILKVENYHIAIRERNIGIVMKRLKEFGFFIEKLR
ncbi:MAG: hypothetical protein SCK70_10090, partial [bacterium]|nr:hypothetical protein [bacterium]